jgi:peptidoglycan-associated lipoprotein
MLLLCLLCTACPGPREQIVLLDAQPGEELTVTTKTGTTVLTTPQTKAQVRDSGTLALTTLSDTALQKGYGAVLDTLPASEAPAAVYTIHFARGQATVDAEGRATLTALLDEIPRRAVAEVQITGHTDQQGSEAFNTRLSQARAEAVEALLVQGGLPAAWMKIYWRGEQEPLVDLPGQAEPRNRRVVITVR